MKINNGYYIKARCIKDSKIAHATPCVREVWDWILREVNHQDTKVCKRGECIRSISDIQEGLSWFIGWRKVTYKRHSCENATKWLRKAGMIATTKAARGMLIKVLNHAKYNDLKNYECRTECRTDSRTRAGHVPNHKQEGKKERKKKPSNEGKQASEFGDPKINLILRALLKATQRTDFSESRAKQRQYGKHLLALLDRIGKEQFKRRLDNFLSDDFNFKRSSSIRVVYQGLKSEPVGEKINQKNHLVII